MLMPFWGPKHSQFKAPIEYGEVARGAVAAFKVEEKAGKLVLTPAWMSRDMDQAEPPVIANGVVFAYGSGENTAQADSGAGLGFNTARTASRIPPTPTIYALDAQTARSCGRAATRSPRSTTSAASRSPTARLHRHYDGTLYCFAVDGRRRRSPPRVSAGGAR